MESALVYKDSEGFCVTNVVSLLTLKVNRLKVLSKSEPCYSMYDPWISSISMTWKLVRNANSESESESM